MDNPLETITDSKGKPITVGTRVDCGMVLMGAGDTRGKVISITQGDVDYSDEAERAIYYPPNIEVLFDDGDTDFFYAHWDNKGEGYGNAMNHVCQDLDVIE